VPPKISLFKRLDQYKKRTDPNREGKENYRIQQEYIRMLKEEPLVPIYLRNVRSDDPNIVAIDI